MVRVLYLEILCPLPDYLFVLRPVCVLFSATFLTFIQVVLVRILARTPNMLIFCEFRPSVHEAGLVP